jgi:hypothetical protein
MAASLLRRSGKGDRGDAGEESRALQAAKGLASIRVHGLKRFGHGVRSR